ncbi:MepB family protein [Flavobacterium sp.]|uniref:MepB family protein n=1 Tax=Flavobacterium sp. TaxID=239 RepID=UPI00260BE25E|nr:MepB family protein [Flavobacterium sp.]MDD3004033.1 MepB family protein [Flavobacterium sp.]
MSLIKNVKKAFSTLDFEITNFVTETESSEYEACNFRIQNFNIHFRKAKITPLKEGLFVTFWKRLPIGIIAPWDEDDAFDFLIVSVENEKESGYFVFPKSVLMTQKIVATALNDGKRAFRVYPPWSIAANKQASTSQKWQTAYFSSKISWKSFSQK